MDSPTARSTPGRRGQAPNIRRPNRSLAKRRDSPRGPRCASSQRLPRSMPAMVATLERRLDCLSLACGLRPDAPAFVLGARNGLQPEKHECIRARTASVFLFAELLAVWLVAMARPRWTKTDWLQRPRRG